MSRQQLLSFYLTESFSICRINFSVSNQNFFPPGFWNAHFCPGTCAIFRRTLLGIPHSFSISDADITFLGNFICITILYTCKMNNHVSCHDSNLFSMDLDSFLISLSCIKIFFNTFSPPLH